MSVYVCLCIHSCTQVSRFVFVIQPFIQQSLKDYKSDDANLRYVTFFHMNRFSFKSLSFTLLYNYYSYLLNNKN